VKAVAAACDTVRPPAPGVVVLIYHRVGRRSNVDIDLPVATFDEQMAFISAQCRNVTLDEAVALADGATEPLVDDDRPIVAVTFDDGTADFAEVALDVLTRHSVSATIYVATDFVERGVPFPDDGVPVTWGGLRDAMSTGLVTVGSHTHTHALLDRLPSARVHEELDRSIELIGERLGVAARHFAYPKAIAPSPAADRAVRDRFVSAALAGSHPNAFARTDIHRLARTPIQVSDGMRWFTRKVNGGLRAEDAMRRALNRGRYAGQIT
jgi:peptidoglycan/xylan/chitin deacetylase (PgdA/CDA1 family)